VITRKLSEEGRIMELTLYPEIISKSPNPENTFIFGKEFLNTEGKFVLYEQIFNEKNRLFHTDLGIILYGAGILGLFLFIRVLFNIMRKFIKLRFKLKKLNHDDYVVKLGAAFISVYICLIASTFSDGITVANNRVLAYMFLGAVLGYMLNEYKYLSANGNYINTV
jgi:hypothetical protein